MENTPKQVALSGVLQRIVTKDQAKDDFKKYINKSLKNAYPESVVKFWEEVLIEVDKI